MSTYIKSFCSQILLFLPPPFHVCVTILKKVQVIIYHLIQILLSALWKHLGEAASFKCIGPPLCEVSEHMKDKQQAKKKNYILLQI